MTTKTCFKCGETKQIELFYRHPQTADKHLNKCKACTDRDVRLYRETHREQVQQRKLAWYDANQDRLRQRDRDEYRALTPEAKRERATEIRQKHRQRHPDRYRARLCVYRAVRSGKLVRQPCEVCGKLPVEAHHEDYTKPLEVHWLCREHHGETRKIPRKDL